MTGKDGSGGSTGQDKDLDALLSAADKRMLDAIRANLDLDAGLAQILSGMAGITPAGRAAGPPEAGPVSQALSWGHPLDPVRACQAASAAHKIPPASGPKSPSKRLYHHRALITLALAVMAALNIAVLVSLSQSHAVASAQSIARAANPPFAPIAGEPARDLYPLRQPTTRQVVLADKVGASASLRSAADSAGIGGDPVISYLRDSRNGPVLLLSGLPLGTATMFLSIDQGKSCRNCSTVSQWNYYPFPPSGEQFSPGTGICIAGANGQVILRTRQSQSGGQIDVIITSFPDFA